MSRKILVSGAPGTVGTELVRLLSQKGVEVRALVHHIEKSGEVSLPGVEIVEGDLTDRASMSRALKGIDTFFLASSASDTQVAVQAAAIEAAKKAGTGRIVKLSAYGADKNSPVPFFEWHGETEATLGEAGIAYTLIQPFLYMQTLLMNIPTILGKGAIFNCGGGGHIPVVDARDAAAVAAAVLTSSGHDGAVYELTGPASLTWPEMAASISALLGRPVQYIPIPPEAMAEALTEAGMPAWLVRSLVALMQFHQKDPGTVTKTVEVLTGNAARPFAEFLSDYAPAFNAEQPA